LVAGKPLLRLNEVAIGVAAIAIVPASPHRFGNVGMEDKIPRDADVALLAPCKDLIQSSGTVLIVASDAGTRRLDRRRIEGTEVDAEALQFVERRLRD